MKHILKLLLFVIISASNSDRSAADVINVQFHHAPLQEVLAYIRDDYGFQVYSSVEQNIPISVSLANLAREDAFGVLVSALKDAGVNLDKVSPGSYVASLGKTRAGRIPIDGVAVSVMNEYQGMMVFQTLSQSAIAQSSSWSPMNSSDPIPSIAEAAQRSLDRLKTWDPKAEWVLQEISLTKVPKQERWYYKVKCQNVLASGSGGQFMFCIMTLGNGTFGEIGIVQGSGPNTEADRGQSARKRADRGQAESADESR
ncbi:MAG TPA: hypothetical protein DCZ95_05245 [Verrucomicrobia bacterium]|nr:hypothetical protein [Verrucomicrobiota bacterium]